MIILIPFLRQFYEKKLFQNTKQFHFEIYNYCIEWFYYLATFKTFLSIGLLIKEYYLLGRFEYVQVKAFHKSNLRPFAFYGAKCLTINL